MVVMGKVHAAIQRWLNGSRSVEKPLVLRERGSITTADLGAAEAGDEQIALIHRWVEHVWAAYSDQQALARRWIGEALGESRDRARRGG
ncbi:MAG: hypothetical protein NVS2B7_11380 [Herpetosiphon sp.]